MMNVWRHHSYTHHSSVLDRIRPRLNAEGWVPMILDHVSGYEILIRPMTEQEKIEYENSMSKSEIIRDFAARAGLPHVEMRLTNAPVYLDELARAEDESLELLGEALRSKEDR